MTLGRRFGSRDRLDMALDGLIERLGALESDALLAMSAAWKDQDAAVHADAWTAAEACAGEHHMATAIERARARIVDWAESLSGATYADITMYGGGWNPIWRDARRAAAPALIDVAVAFVLGDRLDPAARDVLLAPWRRATDREEP